MKELSILSLFIIGLLFVSCDIETSDNGNFDGYWHLERVDTLATSGHSDLSEKRVFWAVQMNLIQLRGADRKDEGGEGRECYEAFKLEQSVLTLSNPHEKNREAEDPIITEENMYLLTPYGINSLTERFDVLKMDADEMVLRSSLLQLKFRKQ